MEQAKTIKQPEQEYYRVSKVAAMFDIPRQTVYNLINRGVIKAVKLAGTDTYRIPKSEIENYKRASEGYE